MDSSRPQHWAILIGINYYGGKAKSLLGAVEDVHRMKSFLSGRGIEHIVLLTAPEPQNPASDLPSEETDAWPTYGNVTQALRNVTAAATTGDFVYIHFSGHGTQCPADTSPEHQGNGSWALVLYDRSTGMRFLHGRDLATRLNEMCEKGLAVTLVLDCCASGDVVRHGTERYSSIRSVKYDPAIDVAYPFLDASTVSQQDDEDNFRNAQEVRDLLITSPRYTIFCACGPYEVAEEICLPTCGNRHTGALSHFLLRTLVWLQGTEISTISLFHHLRLKFQLYWPNQTPMYFGSRESSFFGKVVESPEIDYIGAMTDLDEGVTYLDAGAVHGVFRGDEYAVFALDEPEGGQPSFHARAENVGQVRSTLVVTNAPGAGIRKQTRWKAKALGLPHWKIPVRLQIGDFDQEWVQASKNKRYLQLVTGEIQEQTCLFTVRSNERSEYEILDETCESIISLPNIPRDQPEAPAKLLKLLEHLAIFKYVQGIENRNPILAFEQSFTTRLRNENGGTVQAGERPTVKDGDEVTLMVENFGDNPLYLIVFDLGPLWQIHDLLEGPDGAEFKVVVPKGVQDIPIRMSLPEVLADRGQTHCEDTIKVFITSIATSLSSLKLPEIHPSGQTVGESTRGTNSHNELSAFLASFEQPLRGTHPGKTAEHWSARNFLVRTFAKNE